MPSPNCAGASDHPDNPIRPMVHFSTAQEAARHLLEAPQRFTCLCGGTRSGKTFLIVRAILERALHFPESRHAILRLHANAAKASIAQDTLPKVARLCFPWARLKEHRGDGYFALPNGSRITIGGLDDDERVEKILGLEYASVFLNEASQIPYESALVAWTRLAQSVPGLVQRAYVDLNPTTKTHWTNVLFGDKRDPLTMQPLVDAEAYARAFLNPRDNAANLSASFLTSLERLPERQRRRFYDGVYVEATDDALWSYEIIDRHRCAPGSLPPEAIERIVVAVDPAGGHKQNNDSTGIVVAALGRNGEAYVLADRSCRGAPETWSRRAVTAFHEFGASTIVAEVNFGGDMVIATLRAIDPTVPIKEVVASRGKAVRAEPVSVRYALGHVHHVGRFAELEDELCAFSSAGYNGAGSPDHADAAIWALTSLFALDVAGSGIIGFYEQACGAA